MHPILFRIPLPHWPLRLWWALAVLAALAAVYAGLARRRSDRNGAITGAVVTVVLASLAFLFRSTSFEAGNLPIFSYGVMLGLALICGWFLTLRLAPSAGISKDVVANGFLVAALFALAGARLLYVITNHDKFESAGAMLNLRSGGYSLYGGLLGGVLGSWVYLRGPKIAVLRWADLVAPSLAAGLFLGRIGCWLFGCDFGTRLGAGAPAWLQRLGTFPHWLGATQDAGEGSEPYLRQREVLRGTPEGMELLHRDVAFPVHPTQIYEALVGLALLALVLLLRKRKVGQGRTFSALIFGYGVARYLIEFVRDDSDHVTLGAAFSLHVMVACGLGLFALGFTLGIGRAIRDPRIRLYARVGSFVPAFFAFFALRPAAFAAPQDVALSVSQWFALGTGLVAAYLFGNPPQGIGPEPRMIPITAAPVKSIPPPAEPEPEPEPADEEEDDEDEDPEAPLPAPVPG